MPDIGSITAALTSFNALKNIAQTMMDLHDTKSFQLKVLEFNGALIDAQTKIFSVNEERSTLVERVRELEKKIADLEAWETEKQRYELKQISRASFAYALKQSAQGTEPPHQICANCYQRGKKSILQQTVGSSNFGPHQSLMCPECKAIIVNNG